MAAVAIALHVRARLTAPAAPNFRIFRHFRHAVFRPENGKSLLLFENSHEPRNS
ncbi:hypothetical protein [Vineibacter terrae]|uniref:hypothetical protein n=1 Tax=Vineibacter terrae TaxID=2586908 RepID=UPI0015B567C4|nr:hypothetical protein [Vineibacter terrae]